MTRFEFFKKIMTAPVPAVAFYIHLGGCVACAMVQSRIDRAHMQAIETQDQRIRYLDARL